MRFVMTNATTRLMARIDELIVHVAAQLDMSLTEADHLLREYHAENISSSPSRGWFTTTTHEIVEWELARRSLTNSDGSST